MEIKHLNLVDETNVQMALCPKDTSFYIIITSDVQWVQKNLIVQKNSNRLCTQFQLNDAKFPETQTIYTAEWKAYIMVT